MIISSFILASQTPRTFSLSTQNLNLGDPDVYSVVLTVLWRAQEEGGVNHFFFRIEVLWLCQVFIAVVIGSISAVPLT